MTYRSTFEMSRKYVVNEKTAAAIVSPNHGSCSDGNRIDRAVRSQDLVAARAVADLSRQDLSPRSAGSESTGTTLWLTGLSGAGKSTIAAGVVGQLRERGLRAEWLDGDELRRVFGQSLGFSREDRFQNISRAVYIAGLLNRHGVNVVVSMITPYAEMRDYARSELPRFAEIYVDCPLAVCEARDVKGLYGKARRGEIQAFTGISDPYEAPAQPDLVLRTAENDVDDCVRLVLETFITLRAGLER
ncbi:adenylyl-sulfate kinase [Paenibacillus agaridevorans]|uniref:adenylyl-sulfate kinase n=1 Tax=Paenibacillus agaridevorans TaxID=171404 RepID=UPI001FE7658F|nr:adenylyl-sulfate kinase [Paenibacillus agaridevorans]